MDTVYTAERHVCIVLKYGTQWEFDTQTTLL